MEGCRHIQTANSVYAQHHAVKLMHLLGCKAVRTVPTSSKHPHHTAGMNIPDCDKLIGEGGRNAVHALTDCLPVLDNTDGVKLGGGPLLVADIAEASAWLCMS